MSNNQLVSLYSSKIPVFQQSIPKKTDIQLVIDKENNIWVANKSSEKLFTLDGYYCDMELLKILLLQGQKISDYKLKINHQNIQSFGYDETIINFSIQAPGKQIIESQANNFQKIDSILKSKVEENHPGIAVGILKDGNIIYEKYFGLSNLQHKVKFDENTRSNIASTAKQFTA